MVGGTVYLARRVARDPERLHALGDRLASLGLVAAIRERYRSQLDFLIRRLRPEGALGLSLTGSLVLIALTGWGFGMVVQDVLAGESFNPLDRPLLSFFIRHREPWLTTVAYLVTSFGSSAVLVPLLVGVALLWRWRGKTWRPAVVLAGGYGGAVILYWLVKVVVRRPRPSVDLLRHFSGFSFPSGHATQAIVAWGLLAALASGAAASWPKKVAAWAGAFLLTFMVGVSRVYLGAHWPTDVIGGWVLGALWLSALLTLARTLPGLRNQERDSSPAGEHAAVSSGGSGP